MASYAEVVGTQTVHAGRSDGAVVRCGVVDTVLADLPTSVVFFYAEPLDVARLAEGLSTALARVPVFAGRLRTIGDELEIVCDDAGVPLTVVEQDLSLAEAIARITLPGNGLVRHVDAPAARHGGQPLLTVQLTRLAEGASALGCSWHHAVGDMQSFMLLMRTWSAAVTGAPLPVPVQPADQDAYLDQVLPARDCGRPGFRLPPPEETAVITREVSMALRSNRTVQVYFGPEEIERLRAEFTAAAGRRLSTNDVLCAHVVTTVRQLDEDTADRHLVLPVNVRRILGLPDEAIGNLVSEIYLACPGGAGPAELAAAIRDAVTEFPSQHLSLRTNQEFLAAIGRGRLRECVPIGFNPANRTITISNWSRFGTYDIEFDGQRPVCFSGSATLQLPWVCWAVEGFANTGFLFTIVLPAALAAKLRSAAGRAAIHRRRDPEDPLPALATAMRKLV